MQPDMNKMMQAMQKAQQGLLKAQAEVAATKVEGQAGGGAVRVTCTGDFKFHSVKIQPEAVDVNDLGMLEDLLVAALNDATVKAQKVGEQKMSASMGGLGLPPGLGF